VYTLDSTLTWELYGKKSRKLPLTAPHISTSDDTEHSLNVAETGSISGVWNVPVSHQKAHYAPKTCYDNLFAIEVKIATFMVGLL
jgi:hypothetical protein